MSTPGPWQYKTSQRLFTDWLIETSSSNPLAKCRHPLKSHEMKRLAEGLRVANLRIPKHILKALDETISGRKAAHEFHTAKFGAAQRANNGHVRFIELLVQVREILVPQAIQQVAPPLLAVPLQTQAVQQAVSPLATPVQDQATQQADPRLAVTVQERGMLLGDDSTGLLEPKFPSSTFENLHFVGLESGHRAKKYYSSAVRIAWWLNRVPTEVSAEVIPAAVMRGHEEAMRTSCETASSSSTVENWETTSSNQVFVDAREEAWEPSCARDTNLIPSCGVSVVEMLDVGKKCEGHSPARVDLATGLGGFRNPLMVLMRSVGRVILDASRRLGRTWLRFRELMVRYRTLLTFLRVLTALWLFYISMTGDRG